MAVSSPASLMGAKVAPGTLKVGARSRVARVIQVGKRHSNETRCETGRLYERALHGVSLRQNRR
jgi:hypothetical protein